MGWGKICGKEKENVAKESIQLTDGGEGSACVRGEKKCNKLLSFTVTVKHYEGKLECNRFIVLYHYSVNCGLPFGYPNLNYTFSHHLINVHYKTTLPINIKIMSQTFNPKTLQEM